MMKMNKVNFSQTGTLIEELRKDMGLTQKSMAEIFGVTKPAICQWESGMGIKTESLYKIAKFFNISVEELLNGKLDSETNEDYWNRNYDLDSCYFEGPITKENIDQYEKLIERCVKVKERFYSMVPYWALDKLNELELKEFDKLKSHFQFDFRYGSMIMKCNTDFFFVSEDDQKKIIKKVISKLKNKKEEIKWEIMKLYTFTFDTKEKEAKKSSTLKAMECYIKVLNQNEKDNVLDNYLKTWKEKNKDGIFYYNQPLLRNLTYEEIEKKPIIKILLNGGCNCFKNQPHYDYGLDEENISTFEGKIEEQKYKNYNYNDVNILIDEENYANEFNKNWELYTYKGYNKLIDESKTKYLKALVNYKDSNPLKYYEALKEWGEEK